MSQNIHLQHPDDINTFFYFFEPYLRVQLCKEKGIEPSLEDVEIAQRFDAVKDKIVAIRNGYLVLDDKTIVCSASCDWFTASFDGMTEADRDNEYKAMIY